MTGNEKFKLIESIFQASEKSIKKLHTSKFYLKIVFSSSFSLSKAVRTPFIEFS